MTYAYVYAPVTGQNWGQQTYCYSGSSHTVVSCLGGQNPLDISGSAGNSLYFYGSAVIQSIRTRKVSGVCAIDPAPWDYGVVVDFFAEQNAQCYIGSIGYGHVQDRINNGIYNTRSLRIGELPPDCNCGCSDGIHTHIQFKPVGGLGEARPFNCYQTLYVGSTWIYRWIWGGWC